MMDPLSSSLMVPGRTIAGGPVLQRTVAVAPMRTAIMTTAGLARNTADCSSDSVAVLATAGRPAASRSAARKQAIAPAIHALAIVLIVPSLAPRAWTSMLW